jgi:hypothetical protein
MPENRLKKLSRGAASIFSAIIFRLVKEGGQDAFRVDMSQNYMSPDDVYCTEYSQSCQSAGF